MPKEADPIPAAIRESKAQTRMLEILQPHSPETRARIMTAIWHLFQAEAAVSGILDRFSAGSKEPEQPEPSPAPQQLQ